MRCRVDAPRRVPQRPLLRVLWRWTEELFLVLRGTVVDVLNSELRWSSEAPDDCHPCVVLQDDESTDFVTVVPRTTHPLKNVDKRDLVFSEMVPRLFTEVGWFVPQPVSVPRGAIRKKHATALPAKQLEAIVKRI